MSVAAVHSRTGFELVGVCPASPVGALGAIVSYTTERAFEASELLPAPS